MKKTIILILIINSVLLLSCKKNVKLETYNNAKEFENNLISAITKGDLSILKEKISLNNIIGTLDSLEQKCKETDTVYKFNKEYMLQTAAINDKDDILKIFIENGVNPKADYVITNKFSIKVKKTELEKKHSKLLPIEEAINDIKKDNKGYIDYYENIGANIEFNIKTNDTLELKITIPNYAWTMANVLKKNKSIAVLSEYQEKEITEEVTINDLLLEETSILEE